MSPVLQALADLYRSRRAGRSASASRDLIVPLKDLLKKAGCQHGPLRSEAMQVLQKFEGEGILVLRRYSKDPAEILDVRFPLCSEDAFFRRAELSSPSEERARLAVLFEQASRTAVPSQYQDGWRSFCEAKRTAAVSGGTIAPFNRSDFDGAREILDALPKLLAWQGESFVRFASTILFRDSKRLEKLRKPLQACLATITKKEVSKLKHLGIVETERSMFLHGPLRLLFEHAALDLSILEGPARIASADVLRSRIETDATRCLTVENASMLHELAKLRPGILLASSGSEGGYANSAVLSFLQKLPEAIECWHFGDSDPKGFDILRDMRERTGRTIRPLHMAFRPVDRIVELSTEDRSTIERLLKSEKLEPPEKAELERMAKASSKGDFEQESLGRPNAKWPFY